MNAARVLIVSHGHPQQSKGGGEMAAHQLHDEFTRQGHSSLLLAASTPTARLHPGALAAPDRARADGSELLLAAASDDFHLGSVDPPSLRMFRRVLDRFRPAVVNFHHYFRIGVEAIREVKRFDRNVPVVLTLHEYLAICHRHGQMLKTNGQLCFRSSPTECAACFPERSPAQFHARKRYIQSFLQRADAYVSPSKFLVERYVDWGLPAERFSVIENGQTVPRPDERIIAPPIQLRPDGTPDHDAPRRRFAFFGQINPYKGVDLLLEAMNLLSREDRKDVIVEIYGGGLGGQSQEFRAKIDGLHEKVRRQVTFHGEYEPSQLGNLITRCDWVVVPSIWWENSPLVIQEAFKYKRPVICAGIGGMAEKVEHMKTGLHFRAHNARDLAETLVFAARMRGLWFDLVKNIVPPTTVTESAQAYLALFQRLQSQTARDPSVVDLQPRLVAARSDGPRETG